MYLRYHHLGQITSLAKSFREWKKGPLAGAPAIEITELYHYPHIAQYFIDEKVYKDGKSIMFDLSLDNQEGILQGTTQDYIGSKGEYLDEFLAGLTTHYQNILLTEPTTSITFGYEPDDTCKNCQFKDPENEVGLHCVNLYGSYIDLCLGSIITRIT